MKFGELCLCRLSMCLERLQHLQHLDMRATGLDRLPEVWKLQHLETLDVGENKLGMSGPSPFQPLHPNIYAITPYVVQIRYLSN